MSRNSGGTYTLPTGNPVVTATTITSTWANTTLSDLATEMSDSLSRSGKGGMSAALRGIDGAVGNPAVSFTAEATTGFYRESAGVMSVSILGTKVGSFSATASAFTTVHAGAGTVSAPSISFSGDTNTGLYSITADVIGVAINGSEQARIDATGLKLGTTSDFGTAGNAVPVIAGIFRSLTGSETAINNTSRPLITLPSVANGVWLISAWIDAADVSNYSSHILALTQGTTVFTVTSRMGALLTLSVSSPGLVVSATQNSGANALVSYSITRLA